MDNLQFVEVLDAQGYLSEVPDCCLFILGVLVNQVIQVSLFSELHKKVDLIFVFEVVV